MFVLFQKVVKSNLDVVNTAEPVQLVEKLQHGPLHLPVSRLLTVEPLRPNGVQLVDEDDRGRLLLCQRERVAHQLCAVSNEHLEEGNGPIEYVEEKHPVSSREALKTGRT